MFYNLAIKQKLTAKMNCCFFKCKFLKRSNDELVDKSSFNYGNIYNKSALKLIFVYFNIIIKIY